MKVITLVVGQVATNCYLVEDGGEVGIIDPGDDGDFIIRKIQDMGTKPVWVAVTHGHFDHVLAVTELVLTYSIPFYLHPEDQFLLKRAKESSEYFLGISADPVLIEPNNFPSGSQARLGVGKVDFEIIEAPGHTPGSVCLYSKKEKVLFCGDLIFAGGGVGRTDFEYCSEEDLKKSIKKILKLPEDIMVYPGHGGVLTIHESK